MATKKPRGRVRADAAEAQSDRQARIDGWQNSLTGIGTSRDKRTLGEFSNDTLLATEDCETMWRGHDMAARIIEKKPKEMLRAGYEVKIQPEEEEKLGPDGEPLKLGPDGKPLSGEEAGPLDPDAPLGPDGKPLDPEAEGEPKLGPDGKPLPPEAGEPKLGPDGKPLPAEPSEGEGEPKLGPDGKPLPPDPEELKKRKLQRGDFGGGFPPKKGPPGAGAGGPPGLGAPPPPKPPGVIKQKDGDVKKQSEELAMKLEDLKANERLFEALAGERGRGGAAVLIGANDGKDPREPLDLESIRSVDFLTCLTPRELIPVQWYADPLAPKYGEPEVWRIQPEMIPQASITSRDTTKKPPNHGAGDTSGTPQPNPASKALASGSGFVEIHESRLLIFPGVCISKRQRREQNGWGDSVLQRCHEALRDFGLTWGSAAVLMADFSQAVIKIQGLSDLIATNQDDIVIKRAILVDMMRSSARAILLDSEEDFERKATPMTGMPEMLDRFVQRLAAAAEMPVTLLMGVSPAGMNATGESDIRNWYDGVSGEQGTHLKPHLKRLMTIIFRSKEGPTKGKLPTSWSIQFNKLWQMTEKEKADIRLVQAQADEKYITQTVVTPEEVAASRFGGDEWSGDTTIDFATREEMAVKHEEDQAAHEVEKKKLTDAAAKGKLPVAPPPGAPPAGKPPAGAGGSPFAKRGDAKSPFGSGWDDPDAEAKAAERRAGERIENLQHNLASDRRAVERITKQLAASKDDEEKGQLYHQLEQRKSNIKYSEKELKRLGGDSRDKTSKGERNPDDIARDEQGRFAETGGDK